MNLQELFESESAPEPEIVKEIRRLIELCDVPISIRVSKSRSGTSYTINRLKSKRDDTIMSQEDRFPGFITLLKKLFKKHVAAGDKINIERPSRYFSDAQEAKKAGTNTQSDLDLAWQSVDREDPTDPSSFPRVFVLRQETENMDATFDLTFNTTHSDSKVPAQFAKYGSSAETAAITTAYTFKVPEEVAKRFVKLARGAGKTFVVNEPDQAKFKKLLELLHSAGAEFKTYSYGPRDYEDFKDRRIVNAVWSLTPYKELKRAAKIDDPQIFILTSEFADKQDKQRR
jgi:hypothetical protein